MGGGGKFVEADEAFIGRRKGVPLGRAFHHKAAIVTDQASHCAPEG
jgi:hypothetical protein